MFHNAEIKLTKDNKLKIKEILELYLDLQTHDLANKLLISFLQKLNLGKARNHYALIIKNNIFFNYDMNKIQIYLYNLNPIDIIIQYQGCILVDDNKSEILQIQIIFLKRLLNDL